MHCDVMYVPNSEAFVFKPVWWPPLLFQCNDLYCPVMFCNVLSAPIPKVFVSGLFSAFILLLSPMSRISIACMIRFFSVFGIIMLICRWRQLKCWWVSLHGSVGLIFILGGSVELTYVSITTISLYFGGITIMPCHYYSQHPFSFHVLLIRTKDRTYAKVCCAISLHVIK